MQLSNLELVRNASRFAFENRSSVKKDGLDFHKRACRCKTVESLTQA